jgi:hypothetical protein
MLKFLSVAKEKTNDGHIKWVCECTCGNVGEYIASRVRNKKIHQCKQCSIKDNATKKTTHGMKYTGTYSSWSSMKDRCLNDKSKDFEKYGKKGISICDEWIDSFEKFYLDMGERPKGCSIDRINNNLGYFKENCRWATNSDQQKNKSTSCFWLVNGNLYESLQEAADFYKVKKQTIIKWVDGWTDKRRNKNWSAKDGCKRIPKY